MKEKTFDAFFALLRSGLWELANDNYNDNLDVNPSFSSDVDWDEVYQLTEEQSVIGLIADGIDRIKVQNPSFKILQKWTLQFIGSALQLEQRNQAMNKFIGGLISKLREEDIYTLLVKGQGVGQCYERPLWRTNGDVDLFLSYENYQKAKEYLRQFAASIESEGLYEKHLGMTIDGWTVELHGRLRCGISSKLDNVLDEIQKDTFYSGNVRSWDCNGTQIFLLGVENDIFYVFTHFLGHFYKGGIGLRQICDWCRLMWKYKDTLDVTKLESYIMRSGLKSEWMAFGAFAVEFLGMPVGAVPMLNDNDNVSRRLRRKAERIKDFIMMSGNFGHNRDMSYYYKYPYVIRKCISMKQRIGDLFMHAKIFPLDSLRFSFRIMLNGVRSAIRGE